MALTKAQQARNRVGTYARHRPGSPEHEAARRELAAEKLAAYIRRVVDEAPPLSPEQRDRLAVLLRGDAG